MPLEKRQKVIRNPQTGANENVDEVFEVAGPNEVSYEQGQPKNHHFLYYDSGDLVFQHSKVLSDMFEVGSNETDEKDGTVDSPLVLQDKARGWELIL
ncbi:2595_t:CDS:2, partial [Acaulospora colombiana]